MNKEKVKVYFSLGGWEKYQAGEAVTASTERFFPSDLVHFVPKEEVEKITHGGTIAHIKERKVEAK